MRRFICGISLLLSASTTISGMPAYPGVVTLEDGMHIYLKGDEYCKWGQTEEGYTILPQENSWVYAKISKYGYAEPTDIKVSSTIDESTKAFLSSQPLEIPVKINKTARSNYLSLEFDSTKSPNVVGNRRALVILMSFADVEFKKGLDDFDRLFNEIGYSEDNAIGSVKDFFLWSSYGQLNFSCDVIGPFTASHDMKYYGKNSGVSGQDQNPYSLFEEALNFAVQTVNLAEYDSDDDGYVDNIHIIFAGHGEESGARSDAIWSHEMTFPAIEIKGVKIDRYSCTSELRGNSGNGISRIGPHCHEMGHALGAMDYYDVDYSTNGAYQGTGNWDIMASGSWNNEGITPPDFNPYVKIFDFGWAQAQTLEEGFNEILPSEEHKDQIYLLRTVIDNDFYLIENRRQISFDSGIPGEGLLIFHIGPEITHGALTNNINSHYPQQCYIVCASADTPFPTTAPSSYGDINSAGCPYPGASNNNEFSVSSIPSALCFDQTYSGITLSDISEIEDSIISLYNGTLPLPTYVWTEDFETSNWQSCWQQEDNFWKVSTTESDDNKYNTKGVTNDSPIIHETRYLFSRYSSLFNNRTVRYPIQTQVFTLENGKKYGLELEYYNSPQIVSSSPNPNKLNIYLRKSDSETLWITSLEDTQHSWLSTEIQLPNNIDSDEVSLIFEGEGKSAGYICIDNIKLIEKTKENGIDYVIKDIENCKVSISSNTITFISKCVSEYYIHDISGRLVTSGHLEDGQYYLYLSKGTFIIHFSNDKLSPLKVII